MWNNLLIKLSNSHFVMLAYESKCYLDEKSLNDVFQVFFLELQFQDNRVVGIYALK